MARKPIPSDVQASVLVKSRRRCCICFGLNRDTALKSGQIAHLDSDASNPAEENLAFLCFDHHDQYDSTTRQSKNFTLQEVKAFRTELHAAIQLAFGAEVRFGEPSVSCDPIAGHYVRGGEYDSAELHVERLADGQFHVTGLALWGKKREYGPNLGELDFMAGMKGQTLEFVAPRHDGRMYKIVLSFGSGRLSIEEENWVGMYGMNVSFGGEYEKAT